MKLIKHLFLLKFETNLITPYNYDYNKYCLVTRISLALLVFATTKKTPRLEIFFT